MLTLPKTSPLTHDDNNDNENTNNSNNIRMIIQDNNTSANYYCYQSASLEKWNTQSN